MKLYVHEFGFSIGKQDVSFNIQYSQYMCGIDWDSLTENVLFM
jgi:hypothetical protein